MVGPDSMYVATVRVSNHSHEIGAAFGLAQCIVSFHLPFFFVDMNPRSCGPLPIFLSMSREQCRERVFLSANEQSCGVGSSPRFHYSLFLVGKCVF